MARIIDDQVNVWGRQQGVEPQRSDLWVVDFTQALSGLASVAFDTNPQSTNIALPFVPPKLGTYFVSAVGLPELRVRSEVVRRDSRPYQMPSWDEPCDVVRMVFILDCFRPGKVFNPYRSDIYQMLDVWRAVVRAGRGSMSTEFAITLDNNYRIDYAYNVGVNLMRGVVPNASLVTTQPSASVNELDLSMQYTLVNCWLSSFKLTELNYESAKIAQIEAVFYAEDVRQAPQPTT